MQTSKLNDQGKAEVNPTSLSSTYLRPNTHIAHLPHVFRRPQFLNPGGSPKDRVALQIISDAERSGLLVPNTGSRIFEGTVGSTGISIATVARAK